MYEHRLCIVGFQTAKKVKVKQRNAIAFRSNGSNPVGKIMNFVFSLLFTLMCEKKRLVVLLLLGPY